MANCNGEISAGLLNDCLINLQPGVKNDAWIMNLEDIDKGGIVKDVANDLIITTLGMLSTKAAFKVEVIKNSLGGTYSNVPKDFGPDYFLHQVDIKVTDYNNLNKLRVQELNKSETVVILENKGADDETKFEIYGLDSGLKLGDTNRATNENSGILNLSLKSRDGEEEPNLPYTIWNTDYATTKAAIVALETPAP